jgi:hypothetical protein
VRHISEAEVLELYHAQQQVNINNLPGMAGVIIIIVGVLFLLLLVILLRDGKTESYSLDHAILNASPPRTLWMNMGYWKVKSRLYHSLIVEYKLLPRSM